MAADTPEFTDIAHLTGALDRVGRGFGQIVRVFHEVVGPDLARVATPVKLRTDHATGAETLVIRCASSAWAQTIGFMELDILDRLRSALPEFRATRIHARAGAPPQIEPPPPPPPLGPLPAEHEARLQALADHIPDPALRARVLAASIAMERRRLTPPNP